MLRPTLFLVVVMASCTLPARSTAQVAPPKLDARRAAAVDEAVRSVMDQQKLIGAAVGIIREGQVVYLKGYGLADQQKKIPVTERTVFNWASNSKPMAAILALQLAEKGQLDLDADVRRYVPEFPAKAFPVTCREILCHQSGLPHYANGKVVPADGWKAGLVPPDPIHSIGRFAESPLIFNPGEKSEYSSYAYILLSAAIQGAGKQGYDQQVKDRISGPLRMASLQLDGKAPGPDWAAGYTWFLSKPARAPEEAEDWKFGAGGYKSDVGDFARWAAALMDHRLVSPGTERMMWKPQSTKDGKPTGMGLGFVVEDGRQGLKVSHNGGQPEASTRMVLYPRARHGVVVMSNCSYARVAEVSTAVYSALDRK